MYWNLTGSNYYPRNIWVKLGETIKGQKVRLLYIISVPQRKQPYGFGKP